VSLAKKIVVTHCARAVYTARVPVHGTYTAVYTVRHGAYAAVYTARSRPCTRPVHGRVHSRVHMHTCTPPLQSRVRAIYMAVYTASTQPYTRALYTARIRLCKYSCTRVYTGRVHGRVHGPSCTWQVGLPGHVHIPRRHVHSPFTAVYTAVSDGRYTAVRHVHTSIPPLKGLVRAMYTSVYMASTQSCTWQVGLHGRVHGPKRNVTAVGRVHGRTVTRHVYGRVHVPYTAV